MIVLVCLEPPAAGRASRAALELACGQAEKAQVIVLCAGGPAASPALALARSCARVARVLHIDEPTLDPADFLTVGLVLAEAARHLEAGLVITGERSDGEGQGLVPAAIAHHWRAPMVSRVQAISAVTAETVEITTRAGGQLCTLACPLPLVLSTPPSAALQEPERGAARSVEPLPLAQLGLDASRLVPRPDLLGALVPASVEDQREMSWQEFAAALVRPR